VKVAQICPTFFGKASVIGGAERYVLELSRHMSRDVEVSIITFSRNDPRLVVERDAGLEIRRYPVKYFVRGHTANPLNIAFLKDLRGFDVLHCYGYPHAVSDLTIAFAKLYRKKLFVTDIGGGGVCLSTYLSKVGFDTRRLIGGFLLLSAYSAESYSGYLDRVRVIRGGVDAELFRPLAVARDRTVLFVGRLISAKGANYLVEAVDSATPLRIVGEPYDERYVRELQNMAKGRAVQFLTDVSDRDLVREYSSAMVTVVPSVLTDVYGNDTVGELLSLVALESMACGTPVIATRCGALPETVEDGVTGFLVPPNDAAAIRERIRFFFDRPDVALGMGAAGRERVLREFSWERVVARSLEAYREALQS
jgi:glycosyltransferase involved in cell wall biosynthesis